MEQGYLIDTNVAIDYMSERLPSKALDFIDRIINDQYCLSVINKIELLGFKDISRNEEKAFRILIENADIIPLSDNIIEKTIALRKAYTIKLPDAIIAASAITADVKLITRNVRDFRKINELIVNDPLRLQ